MKSTGLRKLGGVDAGPMITRSNSVGEVRDAYNEQINIFIQNFKKEYRKQWQNTASVILKSAGFSGTIADLLQIKDDGDLDNCASPVRKKQKSNDYGATASRLPVAAKSTAATHSTKHGLSDDELARIHKLKRAELIAEIEKLGGDYHKSWSKGNLVEALLTTHAMFHLPPTQVIGVPSLRSSEISVISNTGNNQPIGKSTHNISAVDREKESLISEIEIIDIEQHIHSSEVASMNEKLHAQNDMISKVARPIADAKSARRGKNEINKSKSTVSSSSEGNGASKPNSDAHDDCMSLSSNEEPPKVENASIVREVTNMDVDETPKLNARAHSPSADHDEEDIFETAKENFSQSQFSQFKPFVVTKNYTSTLSNIPGSDVKPARSSPSVPAGIVDSAKKQLLSSQKKTQLSKGQHLAHTSSNIAHKLDLEQKGENGQMEKCLSNRVLVLPTIENGNPSSLHTNSGLSEKVKASTEARNERIALVKALSKKTSQKIVQLSAASFSGSAKTLSSSTKYDPKDRLAEFRLKHQKQADQSKRSLTKATPLDKVKYTPSNVVATIKQKPSTQHDLIPVKTKSTKEQFVSYEMTDGEYESDDDDSEDRESKMIPEWARSSNLTKALEIQYSKKYAIDPDELFGEVETCNLEAIFGLKLPKFRHRNSSGDWTKDRVTREEKRMYKLKVAQL